MVIAAPTRLILDTIELRVYMETVLIITKGVCGECGPQNR